MSSQTHVSPEAARLLPYAVKVSINSEGGLVIMHDEQIRVFTKAGSATLDCAGDDIEARCEWLDDRTFFHQTGSNFSIHGADGSVLWKDLLRVEVQHSNALFRTGDPPPYIWRGDGWEELPRLATNEHAWYYLHDKKVWAVTAQGRGRNIQPHRLKRGKWVQEPIIKTGLNWNADQNGAIPTGAGLVMADRTRSYNRLYAWDPGFPLNGRELRLPNDPSHLLLNGFGMTEWLPGQTLDRHSAHFKGISWVDNAGRLWTDYAMAPPTISSMEF